jgi:hypothetical protein
MSAQLSSRRTIVTPARTEFTESPTADQASDPWLAVLAEKVRGMHYGTVQITVHDSRVVQIERTERTRFEVPRQG